MAKDPAFLFYPGDWLGGTMGMSFEEKGAYMELLIYQFNRGGFTEIQVKAFLRNDDIWDSLKGKFSFKDGLYYNKRLAEEKEKRVAYTESRRQSRLKSDEDNVRIYIVRNNVRLTYKIGSSVNPIRRYNELHKQNSPAIMEDIQGQRDLSLIWYSNPVERKTEKYLHTKFKNKRLSGEWFALELSDLELIKSEFLGVTYEKRTEDENEIIVSNTLTNNNTVPVSRWESEKKLFLNAEQYHYKILTARLLDKGYYYQKVNEFLNNLEEQEDFKSDKELKKHFKNWLDKPKSNGVHNGQTKYQLETQEKVKNFKPIRD